MVLSSIVIPVYNDPHGLSTTVDSVLNQTTQDYEVIIADNGSSDNTVDIAKEYTNDDRVELVREMDVQSSYAARNTAIQITSGSYIIFLDADMWVEEDYVEQITRYLDEMNLRYTGCDVDVVTDDGLVSRFDSANGFPVRRYIERYNFAPTCCLTVKRDVFDEVGLFDQRLVSGGDLEFGHRVSQQGIEQGFVEELTVYHPARETLHSIFSKFERVGRGRTQLHRYYPEDFRWHPLVNPLLYLPPNPLEFYRDMRTEAEGWSDLPAWYAIKYLTQAAQLWGSLQETLIPTNLAE